MTRVAASAQIHLYSQPSLSAPQQGQLSPGAQGNMPTDPATEADEIYWHQVQFDAMGGTFSWVDGTLLTYVDSGEPVEEPKPPEPEPPDPDWSRAQAGPEAKCVTDAKYGAKGDGSTDDHAAICKAMDDCEGSARGLIRFPIGKYAISQPIRLHEQQAVTFRGDCHDGLQYGKPGSGCSIVSMGGEDYVFRADINCNNVAWEHLMIVGWGGIYLANARAVSMNNTAFAGYRGFICPQLWTGVFINTDWSGGNEPGSIGMFFHPGASANVHGVQCTAFDRGIVVEGTGTHISGFRMEVGKHAIVLGEDADGNKTYCNAARIECGTMEANNRSIKLTNAAFCSISEVWIQGHEHQGFGEDGMCELGIAVDNVQNCQFQQIRAGGGFAHAALVDLGGLQFNNKYARCSFQNDLTARYDVPKGQTKIQFARGVMTSMPLWLKPGLLVQDTNANGHAWEYQDKDLSYFSKGTMVTEVGSNFIKISKPTIAPIAGMVEESPGLWAGRSSIGFYDNRKIHIGGAYMTHPADNLVEQSTPLDVQLPVIRKPPHKKR